MTTVDRQGRLNENTSEHLFSNTFCSKQFSPFEMTLFVGVVVFLTLFLLGTSGVAVSGKTGLFPLMAPCSCQNIFVLLQFHFEIASDFVLSCGNIAFQQTFDIFHSFCFNFHFYFILRTLFEAR